MDAHASVFNLKHQNSIVTLRHVYKNGHSDRVALKQLETKIN